MRRPACRMCSLLSDLTTGITFWQQYHDLDILGHRWRCLSSGLLCYLNRLPVILFFCFGLIISAFADIYKENLLQNICSLLLICVPKLIDNITEYMLTVFASSSTLLLNVWLFYDTYIYWAFLSTQQTPLPQKSLL